METKVVKFNLKVFVEEYIFAVESNDNKLRGDLENDFTEAYNQSSDKVKDGMKGYIFGIPKVAEYPSLLSFLSK